MPTDRNSFVFAFAAILVIGTSVSAAPTWPLPEGLQSVEVNGYDLAYVESGAGSPLILVHGTFADYRYWTPQLKAFAEKHRVFAVSLRHHFPEKWNGEGGTFSVRQHVDDLAEFIRKLNLGKVHLLGHSRGGAVALNVAKQNPELVRTLVLADASGAESLLPDTPESQRIAREGENLRASMRKALLSGDSEGAGTLLWESVNGPGAWAQLPPERKQRVLDNIVTGSVVDERPPTTCQQVKQFDFPVLYVTGERSPKRYAAMFAALRQCKDAPEPIIIVGAAHTMNAQNALAFNAAVLEFLAGK